MKPAPLPVNESQRLQALRRYGVLDTPPETAFDELTHLAAQLCAAPISLISFLDERRQWVKSSVGLDIPEVPREQSFGAYAVLQTEPLVIEDASLDERFAHFPFVSGGPQLRFFAGAPLITQDGYPIGVLCVLDRQPRQLTPEQLRGLRIVSHQVMTQLELGLRLGELARSVEEHNRTEDRLRNSEAFYQTLVDTLPQNILRKDLQGRFTFVNRRFCHSIGKPQQEILGKTDFDFFPADLARKYQRDDERVMRTLENLDTIEAHVTPSGEKLFVHVIKTPLYDAVGRVIGIQGIFWDVTQRKKIEQELAAERDLLRALMDNIPDRIYFKDVQSRFLRSSKSMVQRLGVKDSDAILGKTDFDFHPKELAREFYEDEQRIILLGQPLINKLERQFDTEGREIWASVTKIPIYSQSGAIAGIIGISRDVTQLKLTEAALKQARDSALESARVKSEFLANMSHEIRTPMNAITGMTGLLLDTQLSQEQLEYASTIRHSTETLLIIINDILDFSKIEAGKLTLEIIDFELRDAVESTAEMLAELAHKKGLELNCWLAPDVPNCLRGDPGRLRQVLANLLSNATKFTANGEVILRVTKLDETATHAVLHFAVTDTGVGISPEAMRRIFNAFTQADGSTTRKYGGTGLGLSICKQLLALMGGEIGAESVPGRGSTFWFKLPLEKQPPNAAARREFKSGNLTGLRVLVVDDTKTQCDILHDQLSRLKMEVACASSGGEALDYLRRQATAGAPVHLVIADLNLPAMDGLTVARHIKAEAVIAPTKLLMLATLGRRLSPAAMRGAGVDACLVKPLRQSRLYDCLVEIMSDKTPASVPEPAASGYAFPESQASRKNLRVLLAEDNIVNQRLALRQLRKLGYQADAVADGKEVLEALQRIPYDVILMDCHMPEIDGYETARRIRQSEPSGAAVFKSAPYIIALTANALQGDREQCLGAGMNDYLTKPLHLSDLANALQRAWSKSPAATRLETSFPQGILDPAVIAGLRDLREPGQPDPLKSLVELFLRDARLRLDKMAGALEQSDAAALISNAHTLKGSARNLGAAHLGHLCADLEKTAKMGGLGEAADILLEMRGAFQQVEQALLAEVQK